MKKAFLAVFALGLGYLTLWPVPLTPEVYEPLKAPAFTGDFESNDAMAALELVLLPDAAVGPEDLAVMPDGTVYTTDLAGKLYRIDGEVPELIEDLGGRPLGLKAGPDGALYIADSYRGILRWTGPGRLETLVSEVAGAPLIYANQLDIARDGTIYFSNSTDRFDPELLGGTKPTSVMTVWEQSNSGYVARRLPDGTVEKIADGFVYTNGVALSQAEDFLLINETGRARVHKLWLTGDKAGERELFLGNLPGYPDNLERQGDGTFWLAFASPRLPSEKLMPYPFLRKVTWRLGDLVRPAPVHRGMVIQFDENGNILRNLQDPSGRFGVTTSALQVGAQFYVMSLDGRGFGRGMAADLPPPQ
ncbi:strictosidine synthase family protein [Roseobacter sp. MED193]|uniref:SMP-30/gluconolactonase/LRE family protein n=1 Tax=Roseobacter sp. MED193 TaxID=314262 RepID=UPI000068B78C|nr:SMP-30/gluconolactonase/LRE family protein [Roseobacter sp. MED193]EAQ47659.1 strictosidine synthase family protein [Roseobacter sp. MED193]